MTIIASYNIKGGVGKTATAVNLAYLAAQEGAKTLLWDMDPQGASSFYYRLDRGLKGGIKTLLRKSALISDHILSTNFENLDLIPSDIANRNADLFLEEGKGADKALSKSLKFIMDQYEYVFIDCPPSFSRLSENIFRASDALLIPTIPTTLSLRTLTQVRDFREDMDKPRPRILAFFSMVDRRKAMHRLIVDRPPGIPVTFLKTAIPYAADVERMGTERRPVVNFNANSPSTQAYAALWKEIKSEVSPKARESVVEFPMSRRRRHQ